MSHRPVTAQHFDKPTSHTFSRRFGVVIVDMQEFRRPGSDERTFSYSYGSVSDGIAALCAILDLAKELGIPIALVGFKPSPVEPPPILGELLSRVAGYTHADILFKPHASAFSSGDFVRFLESHHVETIVLGGYHRNVCVLATYNDAKRSNLSVLTSDELLFGNISDSGKPAITSKYGLRTILALMTEFEM